jgi:predicted TIM-barrel fold metal-dependent hydrolase
MGKVFNRKKLIFAIFLLTLVIFISGYVVFEKITKRTGEELVDGNVPYEGDVAKNATLIDGHAHLFQEGDAAKNADRLVEEMDKANVSKAVLFGGSDQPYFNKDLYVDGIRREADLRVLEAYAKYPNRFYPMLSGFDPQNPNSIGYIEQQLSTGIWKGIGEIYLVQESLPEYKTKADNPNMINIYRVLAKYNVPIFFHYEQWSEEDVQALYRVMEQNPDVKFVWLHFANSKSLDELENALGRHPNLYISWEGPVSQNILQSKEEGNIAAFRGYINLFEKYPNRFMIGTDVGCLENFQVPTLNVTFEDAIEIHKKLLLELTPQTAEAIAYKNVEKLMVGWIDNAPISSVEVHDQNISGLIDQNQMWSGTIHVTGDITLQQGFTLTIKPGTIIKMAANSDDQHSGQENVKDELTWDKEKNVWKDLSATKEFTQSHVSISIAGTLSAIGTPNNNIIFTSDSNSPTYGDWDTFVVTQLGTGTLKYCTFEWMHAGPCLQNSNSTLSYSIARHILWGGIHAYYASPLIENNIVEDVGHEGIDTLRSSARIRNNLINGTRTAGIIARYAGFDGTPMIIENNTLINSGPIGIMVHSNAIIRNNILIQGKPEDDPKPITYQGYTFDKGKGITGFVLNDEVNVSIVNNVLYGGAGITYSNVSETYALQEGINGAVSEGPKRIEIKGNIFNSSLAGINYLDGAGKRWRNIEITNNIFFNVTSIQPLENAGPNNTIVFPPFISDFDSASAGWDLEPRWNVEIENGNYVLSGSTHSWARAGSISWNDYNFTTKFKIIAGTAHVSFRISPEGRYYFGIMENHAYFFKEKPIGSHFKLADILTTIEVNKWYTISFQIKENNIKIYIDSVLLVDYSDNVPLLHGSIGFETQDNSHFHFDDVYVVISEKHT